MASLSISNINFAFPSDPCTPWHHSLFNHTFLSAAASKLFIPVRMYGAKTNEPIIRQQSLPTLSNSDKVVHSPSLLLLLLIASC
jgi:hypothetical protein